MKRLIILIFLFLAVGLYAGPFGLEMGMQIEDINKLIESKELDNENPLNKFFDLEVDSTEKTSEDVTTYYITPKKKHPMFESYVIFIDKEFGLYRINAKSVDIPTTPYGIEVQNSFNILVSSIGKNYGEPNKIIDSINKTSLYDDDKEWIYSLKEGARTLYATWMLSEKNVLPNDVAIIALKTYAEDYPEKG